VILWLRQRADPMFQESLLIVGGGQEKMEKIVERPLERLSDEDSRTLMRTRFSLRDEALVTSIVKLARGIPRCLVLAGEFVSSDHNVSLRDEIS